ncbi:MAG TPA: glycosyltransferase [Solirubrobacteraceae bacterium]|jgi:glycosyltransferase involved in cell wall biosynthesis|nr:glycosyltransferase [Solirubrobacteraceae bacterium]
MRICIVYDCLYPYTVGGGERWYGSLAERLVREGHEVTYLTLRQWERGHDPGPEGGMRVVAAGPRMSLYTPGGRRRILPPLVYGVGVFGHLLRHGRRYDVVDTGAFPYFSLLAAAALRPFMRYELVVDWFEVWSGTYWRDYLGRLGGRIGELVQRACARIPQRAFCFSQLHAQRLREEHLNGPVTVLRGLYAGSADAGATDGSASTEAEPIVLFAGRLIPEKQVTLAVAAIALAAEQIGELRAQICGDGPERGALERAIAGHGLEGIVSAAGFADGAMLEAEMRRAMCMLVTSRREGYGLVVVEAAARGTPSIVVAGPDNAATELIVDGVNGAIVPSSDARAIADAIVAVHSAGAGLRRSTAAWYAENARRLSLEASLEDVLRGYESARA